MQGSPSVPGSYNVQCIRKGTRTVKALWQAMTYEGVIGSGSRPELAIRDAKNQLRLRLRHAR